MPSQQPNFYAYSNNKRYNDTHINSALSTNHETWKYEQNSSHHYQIRSMTTLVGRWASISANLEKIIDSAILRIKIFARSLIHIYTQNTTLHVPWNAKSTASSFRLFCIDSICTLFIHSWTCLPLAVCNLPCGQQNGTISFYRSHNYYYYIVIIIKIDI